MDSLSRIHALEEPSTSEPILPPAVLVSPIQRALEEQIRVATLSETDGCSVCAISLSPTPPENWYPYQSPVVHGPTSEWTLSQIFHTPMDSTAFYSFSPRLPQLWNPERYSLSDPGPQFIYHVWKAFLKLLGISISLSSGYHPRPMVRLSGRYRR